MPNFKYEAIKRSGEKVNGAIDVANEAEVRTYLRQQGFRPTKIEAESLMNAELSFNIFGGSVSDNEIAIMTRQLAGAGIPLLQAFDILQAGEKNPKLRGALKNVGELISGGSPLWESLSKQKGIFSHLYIHLVRAGESGGALDQILNRLAKYLDDNVRIVRMVKGALVYPAIVVTVGMLVTGGLLIFVIPKFEDMITANGGELPAITKFVIGLSHFLSANILYVLVGIAFAIYSFRKFISTEAGAEQWQRFIMALPIFGDLIMKGATARFSRALGTMLTSGVNLTDAIDICKKTMDNIVVEKALNRVKDAVTGGKSIAVPMAQEKIFPSMMIQMINVGENTGALDQMLLKVADFYEIEVETAVGNMSKLIEPVILVGLGGIVATILIAMYLPIFSIAGSAG